MKLFKSKWFLFLMTIAIGWLGLSLIKIKTHENIVNKEAVDLENKIIALEENNNYLERFIEYFKHPSFLEKEARLKLNYKDPEENVVFVYLDESGVASGSEAGPIDINALPNSLKWLYYVLGY